MSGQTPVQQSLGEGSSSSTNLPPSYDEIRQQAGPLPSKRGEIGFIEGVHNSQPIQPESNVVNLPARHPADRGDEDHDSPTTAIPLTPAGLPAPSAARSPSGHPTTPTPAATTQSTNPANKPRVFKKLASFHGLRILTLARFIVQAAVIGVTIFVWVFVSRKMAEMSRARGDKPGTIPGGMTSAIFIHFVFGFAIVGQLIFLERCLYRLRAERYSYLHPGEMLPRYHDRTRPGGDLSFAIAPWNRPPLPTYAAVLAQSGLGTGDVDDHLIAVPLPPAYGNTRGSRLILTGFLSESLRAQRPPSVHSQSSDLEHGEGVGAGGARLPSVDRETHREQTLQQLERPNGSAGGRAALSGL